MAIVSPYQSDLIDFYGAVSLADYARILGIDECGLQGVNNPNPNRRDCQTIWTKRERDQLARYLLEAQEEIEDEIGYFLQKKWVVGQITDQDNGDPRYVDRVRFRRNGRIKTRWKVLIAGGIKAESTIVAGTAINWVTDPGIVGPVATTVTDYHEIAVYHPGTDVRIIPSKITISGGTVTIEIPKCRAVVESAADNDESGIDYSVAANFETQVDVKRIYNDPSINAKLVKPHTCTGLCYEIGCTATLEDACIYIRNDRLGFIDLALATYSGGSWASSLSACCNNYEFGYLYYCSGVEDISRQGQDSIIRLAHTKMPREMCSCDVIAQAWKNDNNVPRALTRERINNPFGLADGAWIAYQFAQSMTIRRGGRGF